MVVLSTPLIHSEPLIRSQNLDSFGVVDSFNVLDSLFKVGLRELTATLLSWVDLSSSTGSLQMVGFGPLLSNVKLLAFPGSFCLGDSLSSTGSV